MFFNALRKPTVLKQSGIIWHFNENLINIDTLFIQ